MNSSGKLYINSLTGLFKRVNADNIEKMTFIMGEMFRSYVLATSQFPELKKKRAYLASINPNNFILMFDENLPDKASLYERRN